MPRSFGGRRGGGVDQGSPNGLLDDGEDEEEIVRPTGTVRTFRKVWGGRAAVAPVAVGAGRGAVDLMASPGARAAARERERRLQLSREQRGTRNRSLGLRRIPGGRKGRVTMRGASEEEPRLPTPAQVANGTSRSGGGGGLWMANGKASPGSGSHRSRAAPPSPLSGIGVGGSGKAAVLGVGSGRSRVERR